MLVLHEGFIVPAGFHQGIHQLQMELFVKGIHIQSSSADADDFLVVLFFLQQVQVVVHHLQVIIVEGNGATHDPFFLIVAMEQIAAVELHHLLKIFFRFFVQGVAVLQFFNNGFELIHVHRHIGLGTPTIAAPFRADAPAEFRADGGQDNTQAADQGLQGTFRVHGCIVRPHGFNQAVHGDTLTVLQHKVLKQCHALAALAHNVVHIVAVTGNVETAQHGDPHLSAHEPALFQKMLQWLLQLHNHYSKK